MPKATVNGIGLYYEIHGRGEPLILAAGMGADHRSWFPQTREFKRHFTVITFDGRGIGKTDRPSGLYSFGTLAADVIGLLGGYLALSGVAPRTARGAGALRLRSRQIHQIVVCHLFV